MLICTACGGRFQTPGNANEPADLSPSGESSEAMNELAALASRPTLPRVKRRKPLRISGAAFGLGAFSASIAILILTWVAVERRVNRPPIPVAQVAPVHEEHHEPAAPTTLAGFSDTTQPTADGWGVGIGTAQLLPESAQGGVVVAADVPTAPLATTEPATPPSPALLADTRPATPQSQPVLVSAADAPPGPHRPPIRPMHLPHRAVTDAQIDQAIREGAEHLLAQFSHSSWRMPGDYRWWITMGPRPRPLLNDFYNSSPQPRAPYKGQILGLDWPDGGQGQVVQGTYMQAANAFSIQAVLESGKALGDARFTSSSFVVARLMKSMKDMESGLPEWATQNRACRLAALLVFSRPEDREVMLADVNFLLKTQRFGAFRDHPINISHDDLNSTRYYNDLWNHFATAEAHRALGMISDADGEAFTQFWKLAKEHWALSQLNDGSWDRYNADYWVDYWPDKNLFLRNQNDGQWRYTIAGLASLFAAMDFVDRTDFKNQVGRDAFWPPMRRALAWLEQGDRPITNVLDGEAALGPWHDLADLGSASGLKYLGTHDWYREVAARLVATPPQSLGYLQEADRLLFLTKGRPPVMINKLRMEHAVQTHDTRELNNPYWNNRPRDLSNLTRWASHELERTVSWQIASLDRDWSDWTDAAVLYFASHRPLRISPADLDKMRAFAQSGGMLFTQADADDPSYDRFVKELAARLFPEYPLEDLPSDHPIYSVNYHLFGKVPFKAVTNGARILLLYSPRDITQFWNGRDFAVHRNLFEMGANMFLYAGGKRDWRNRLESWYIPAPMGSPVLTLDVARLKYEGNWDPEPGGYFRFRRSLQCETGYDLDAQPVNWADLEPGTHPIAHVTGTAAYEPRSEELVAMRKYVMEGGVLLIDACGGSSAFGDSMRKAIARVFPDNPLEALPRNHPLLNAGYQGMADLRNVRPRQYVNEQLLQNNRRGELQMLSAGKGHVIFSPMDISCGLLGIDTWGVYGYTPEYSTRLMQNILLWTADGQMEP
ncbi:MAG TPA: DUF4159 domain-containing protein [Humisphaera sp.]|nr:DUF4159 domain-containing protein [Humisphaera sp.]